MKWIATAAALMVLASSPAFARHHALESDSHAMAQAVHPAFSEAYGAVNPDDMSNARQRALHECTALEQRTSPTIRDSNLSMFEYRACMDEHGQRE